MALNADAVRDSLRGRRQAGRTPGEAAGEVRWILELFQRAGVMSQATMYEGIDVVDEWIAMAAGPEAAFEDEATLYARFLQERVDITTLTPLPSDKVDAAWREWRQTRNA